MKINAKSYPHPVLGNGDDLGGIFKVEFRYELGRKEIALNPVFALQNRSIEKLLKEGRVSFVTEIECRSTFFRQSFSSREQSQRIVLPAQAVRERVTAGFYICADQGITSYSPSDPHSDYEGASFDIEAGDVLAVGGYCSFIAEKSFDPLKPPVSSFMSIMEGNHHEGPMQVDYESDKISIILSKEDWKNYLEIRGQKLSEGILHSSIVFPVLIDAVYQVYNGNSDCENMNWFGRIEAILDAKGLREKEPFEAAQKILDNPAARSFQSIESLLEVTNDQEYE